MQRIQDSLEDRQFGGHVDVEVIRDGADGPVVIQRRRVHNLVVNAGKRQTWRQASGLNANDWDQFRIGTNGGAASSAQTNVVSPVVGSINTADNRTMVGRTFQLMISYPSGAGTLSASNIQEVAVLNQNTSPGGSALMRAVFAAVNKTTADKLKLTYSVRIT